MLEDGQKKGVLRPEYPGYFQHLGLPRLPWEQRVCPRMERSDGHLLPQARRLSARPEEDLMTYPELELSLERRH